MRYGRIENGRLVDCTDLSAYTPRPDWGQSDQDLIDRVYQAVGGFKAFIAIPDDAQNGMEQKEDGSFGWPVSEPDPVEVVP